MFFCLITNRISFTCSKQKCRAQSEISDHNSENQPLSLLLNKRKRKQVVLSESESGDSPFKKNKNTEKNCSRFANIFVVY